MVIANLDGQVIWRRPIDELVGRLELIGDDEPSVFLGSCPRTQLVDFDGDTVGTVRSEGTTPTVTGNFATTIEFENRGSGDLTQVVCFYQISTDHLRLLRKVEGFDWRLGGYAISRLGTIALQQKEHIELLRLDGSVRKLPWKKERGVLLWKVSPTDEALLFRVEGSYILADSASGEVLSRYESTADDAIPIFQDSSHLLIVHRADELVSDQIVRWNWRTNQTHRKKLAGFEHHVRAMWNRAQTVLLVVCLVLAPLLSMSTSTNRAAPIVVLAGLLFGVLGWGYLHPLAEFHRVDDDLMNLSWIACMVGWLLIATGALFIWDWLGQKISLRILSFAMVITFASAYLIAMLSASKSWHFPIIVISATSTIACFFFLQRITGSLYTQHPIRNAQLLSTRSYRIVDLFVATVAIAIVLFFARKIGGIDVSTKSAAWSLLLGFVFAVSAFFQPGMPQEPQNGGYDTLSVFSQYFSWASCFRSKSGFQPATWQDSREERTISSTSTFIHRHSGTPRCCSTGLLEKMLSNQRMETRCSNLKIEGRSLLLQAFALA